MLAVSERIRIARILKWLLVFPLWLISNFDLFKSASAAEKFEDVVEASAFAATVEWAIHRFGKKVGEFLHGVNQILEVLQRYNEEYVYRPLNYLLAIFHVHGTRWLDELIVIGFALFVLTWRFFFNAFGAVQYTQYLKEQENEKWVSYFWQTVGTYVFTIPLWIYHSIKEGDIDRGANTVEINQDRARKQYQAAQGTSQQAASALSGILWGFFSAIALEFFINLFFLVVQIAERPF